MIYYLKIFLFVFLLSGCVQIPSSPGALNLDGLSIQTQEILLNPKVCNSSDHERQKNLLFAPDGVIDYPWLMDTALLATVSLYVEPKEEVARATKIRYFSDSLSGPFCVDTILTFNHKKNSISHETLIFDHDSTHSPSCDPLSERRELKLYEIKDEGVFVDGELLSKKDSSSLFNTLEYLEMAQDKITNEEEIVVCEEDKELEDAFQFNPSVDFN